MEHYSFSFTGYQNFDAVAEKLDAIYQKAFGFDNYDYRIAVTEAVCNAARYSLQGLTEAEIRLTLQISPVSISTTVYARTTPFDVHSYRKKLQKLLEDPDTAAKDWGDHLGSIDASRGIWYMLTGCDSVYFDYRGQSVTLFAYLEPKKEDKADKKDEEREPRATRIDLLLPRFYIKEHGVIL